MFKYNFGVWNTNSALLVCRYVCMYRHCAVSRNLRVAKLGTQRSGSAQDRCQGSDAQHAAPEAGSAVASGSHSDATCRIVCLGASTKLDSSDIEDQNNFLSV